MNPARGVYRGVTFPPRAPLRYGKPRPSGREGDQQLERDDAPRVSVCEKGKERWHRDVIALCNLAKKAGDLSPMPLESHDLPVVEC